MILSGLSMKSRVAFGLHHKVLIADDEAAIRRRWRLELTRLAKTQAGNDTYEFIEAENPEDVRQQSRLQHPDAYMLDNTMPGKDDGLHLVQEIRQAGFDGPIIMVSGDTHVEQLALSAGATAFVQKGDSTVLDKIWQTLSKAFHLSEHL